MAVAELVPAVAVRERLAVTARDEVVASRRSQHREVRRRRLVQAGQEAVDRPEPALGRDDEVRPALTGVDGAVGCATVSGARTTVVPVAITRPPREMDSVDEPRGEAGTR